MLNAHAEFLMVWSPFHFIGDIGILVGIGFHLKAWIINININIDVSGSLHLEGPPFCGSIYVDFYLFGFTIFFRNHLGWSLEACSSSPYSVILL